MAANTANGAAYSTKNGNNTDRANSDNLGGTRGQC